MRKLSIGATAIAALAFGAENAASEGLLERSPAPTYHAGCSSFHGFFIGANAGGAHLRADQFDADGYRVSSATQGVVVNTPGAFSATDRAFIGGGQIGFNLQRGCTVFV